MINEHDPRLISRADRIAGKLSRLRRPIEGLSLLGVAVEIAFLRRARGLHLHQPSEDGAAGFRIRFRHGDGNSTANIRPVLPTQQDPEPLALHVRCS
jgi:hypothetical protein